MITANPIIEKEVKLQTDQEEVGDHFRSHSNQRGETTREQRAANNEFNSRATGKAVSRQEKTRTIGVKFNELQVERRRAAFTTID